MNAAAWVAVVILAVLAILAIGFLVSRQTRRRRLQNRFGPEYDRTVRESESRKEAEQELLAREERHALLDIRPLAPQTREVYDRRWREVQERFVDAPGFAVTEADALLTAVMDERGYPTDDFEQRLSDLSVAHAATLGHYRTAHEISSRAARQDATTEELRQAMVRYRALFQDLLQSGGDDSGDETVSGDRIVANHAAHGPNAGERGADQRVADRRVRDDQVSGRHVVDDSRNGTDTRGGSLKGRHAARSDMKEAR
jgi:hypothetical protein